MTKSSHTEASVWLALSKWLLFSIYRHFLVKVFFVELSQPFRFVHFKRKVRSTVHLLYRSDYCGRLRIVIYSQSRLRSREQLLVLTPAIIFFVMIKKENAIKCETPKFQTAYKYTAQMDRAIIRECVGVCVCVRVAFSK